jgi:hypothetical protein
MRLIHCPYLRFAHLLNRTPRQGGALISRFAIILLALTAFFALPVETALTIEDRRPLESVIVTVNLEPNGELLVTQELNLAARGGLSWSLYGQVRNLTVAADGVAVGSRALRQVRRGNQLTVSAAPPAAKNWTISYRTSSQLIRAKERDQLYLPLLREPGRNISLLQATFRLPIEDGVESGLTGNVYAIGGVTKTLTEPIEGQGLSFSAENIGPNATVTISAHWLKNVLQLGFFQELRLTLGDLEVVPWIVLGLFLPLVSLAVLLRLHRRGRQQERRISAKRHDPPSALSPLIVGTLVDKKVYPKEIVAMILDLCQRGYVIIIKRNGQYFLSQRRPADEGLEAWEKDILLALFPIANTKTDEQTVRSLNRQSLFNPDVKRAFGAIYEIVTTKNFFAENPHTTRVRYKLFALSLYFASVFGAVWIAVTGLTPYLLLPLAGTIVVCWLIIKLTPRLVRYTSMGLKERKEWLSFRNYLAEQKPLTLEASQSRIFEKYLGYAVALGVTTQWARRFDLDIANIVLVKPDWFFSYEESTTAELAQEIEKFSRSISEVLTEMRGPLVS